MLRGAGDSLTRKVSWFQSFKVLKLQHFIISKFNKQSKFQRNFNVSTFQRFNISKRCWTHTELGYGATELGYGTTNVDAGVGIGMKRDDLNISQKKAIN